MSAHRAALAALPIHLDKSKCRHLRHQSYGYVRKMLAVKANDCIGPTETFSD